MRMEFKGSFLYFRPTWILEDDRIIVRKKVYYISKISDLQIYIPPNINYGFSPHISFIYDNDNRRTIIDFSRDNPDFGKAKEAYKYIKSNTKEGIENRLKEDERKRQEQEKEIREALELEEERKKHEQYQRFRKEMEQKCIAYMLQNPSILLEYKEILDNVNHQFKYSTTIGELKNEQKFLFTNDNFKTLFFDFLIGCTKCKENVEDCWCDKLFIYKSKLLYENRDKIGMCGGTMYKNGLKYNERVITIYKERFFRTYGSIKYQLSKSRDSDIYNIYRDLRHYFLFIYRAFKLIKMHMEFYQNTLKPFEENEELMQIYNNLKKEKCSKEYITEKIYSIYEILYKDNIDITFTKEDIEFILELKETDDLIKKYGIETDDIKSREQLIEIIIKQLSHLEEKEIVMCIINILKRQKDMNIKLKYDIVKNIDNILEEAMLKIKKSEIIENAKKERDRLLKGDLSKEKEFNELSLSTENIKDGFEFEEYVAKLYKKLGYTIKEVTKKSGDQGADVVATKNGTKYVIQAKFYHSPVGNKAVQEVVAALAMYKADNGIVITNNRFTQSAIELAGANNIELVDGNKIEEYKKQILKNI